jgi:hypothetical protein
VRRGRRPDRSHASKPILPGHGKAGNVRLAVDVPPDVKDGLIDVAEARGCAVVDVARDALLSYLLRVKT